MSRTESARTAGEGYRVPRYGFNTCVVCDCQVHVSPQTRAAAHAYMPDTIL
jgi:hypothetical protein